MKLLKTLLIWIKGFFYKKKEVVKTKTKTFIDNRTMKEKRDSYLSSKGYTVKNISN